MGTRRHVVPLLACAAGALAACGLASVGSMPGGTMPDASVADARDTPDTRTIDAPGSPADTGVADVAMPDAPPPEDAPGDGVADAPEASPPDAATTLCEPAYLFCDGFEQGMSAWTVNVKGGTATIDATHAYRGTYALHSHVDAVTTPATPLAALNHDQAWPPTFYTRFYAYLPAPWVPSAGALMNLLQNGGNYTGIQIYLTGSAGLVSSITYNEPMGPATINWISTSAAPLGVWVCLELAIQGPPPMTTFSVSMNGATLGPATPMVDLPPTGILELGLGFSQAMNQGAYDAWFDEIAVSTNPIGCP